MNKSIKSEFPQLRKFSFLIFFAFYFISGNLAAAPLQKLPNPAAAGSSGPGKEFENVPECGAQGVDNPSGPGGKVGKLTNYAPCDPKKDGIQGKCDGGAAGITPQNNHHLDQVFSGTNKTAVLMAAQQKGGSGEFYGSYVRLKGVEEKLIAAGKGGSVQCIKFGVADHYGDTENPGGKGVFGGGVEGSKFDVLTETMDAGPFKESISGAKDVEVVVIGKIPGVQAHGVPEIKRIK